MLKTLQLIALALLAAYAGGALAQADGKIGFVNLDRILRDAAPAVRAQKKLEAEFQKREQELGKIADGLKRMQESLEKNAMTLSESERAKREREQAGRSAGAEREAAHSGQIVRSDEGDQRQQD